LQKTFGRWLKLRTIAFLCLKDKPPRPIAFVTHTDQSAVQTCLAAVGIQVPLRNAETEKYRKEMWQEHEVQLYAFDVLPMDGDDLRNLPLHLCKTNLERLLARRPDGITVAPFERGEIGPDPFRAACRMGLEGLVSKHRDRPYRGGRQSTGSR
jgi:hypothetical protein